MLKFGFFNCYVENKFEFDLVDFMVMYVCYMLFWVMMYEVLFYL